MPHIAPLTDEQAPQTAKPLFDAIQGKLGMVLNIFRTMAHVPKVLEATLKMNEAIQQELPPKLRELAYLKTSMLNDCDY